MTPEDRSILIAEVVAAVQARPALLSEDEQRWVRMAIQREAQSISLRKAIIEKTLTALMWAGLVGAWYVIADFFKSHGFK